MRTLPKSARYCEMCDKVRPSKEKECRFCGAPTIKVASMVAFLEGVQSK